METLAESPRFPAFLLRRAAVVCVGVVLVRTALADSCLASGCTDDFGSWVVSRLGESSEPYKADTEATLAALIEEMELLPLNKTRSTRAVRLWFFVELHVGMVQIETDSASTEVVTADYVVAWDKLRRREGKRPDESWMEANSRIYSGGSTTKTLTRRLLGGAHTLLWQDLARSGIREAEEPMTPAVTGGSVRYLETWDGTTYRIIECIECLQTSQVDCFDGVTTRLEQVGSAWILGTEE